MRRSAAHFGFRMTDLRRVVGKAAYHLRSQLARRLLSELVLEAYSDRVKRLQRLFSA